jgi:hypothetical protein
MAQDQLCKFCEESDEPERGVLLICDLTGSGELPFAIGINCLPDWLTTMLEAIAIPEGIPASAPAELEDFSCDECGLTIGHEADCETGATAEHLEEAARDAQAALELTEKDFAARLAEPPIEDPTPRLGPSGPSPVESSDPPMGSGGGPAVKRSPIPGNRRTSNIQAG